MVDLRGRACPQDLAPAFEAAGIDPWGCINSAACAKSAMCSGIVFVHPTGSWTPPTPRSTAPGSPAETRSAHSASEQRQLRKPRSGRESFGQFSRQVEPYLFVHALNDSRRIRLLLKRRSRRRAILTERMRRSEDVPGARVVFGERCVNEREAAARAEPGVAMAVRRKVETLREHPNLVVHKLGERDPLHAARIAPRTSAAQAPG